MRKLTTALLLALAAILLTASPVFAGGPCPKTQDDCDQGYQLARYKLFYWRVVIGCDFTCVKPAPAGSGWNWLTQPGEDGEEGGAWDSHIELVGTSSGSSTYRAEAVVPEEPAPTPTPIPPTPTPTLEPTPSCTTCVAQTLDGQTVHVTRWEVKADGRVWADVVDPLTGDPIFDAALESTNRWLPIMLPTSTPTPTAATVASATPTLELTVTPAPAEAAIATPTEQPAAAEVSSSPTPTVTKSSPTPSSTGEERGTPPTPPATLAWQGRQFAYRGLARVLVALFGVPPGGLIIRSDGVKTAGEAPFWRFWTPAVILLLAANLAVFALSWFILRLVREKIHRDRELEHRRQLTNLQQFAERAGEPTTAREIGQLLTT